MKIMDPLADPGHHEVDISGWDMTNVALLRRDSRDKERRQAIEKARASVRDTWLSDHIRETRAFLEERRAYAFAFGDPGDEMPVFDRTTFAVRAMDEEDDGA